MKVFHYLNFAFIFLLLIGICVVEDLLVSNSLKEIQTQCYKIETSLERERDDLKNMEIVVLIDNLEYKWTEDESKLCYLVHHKNSQEIGQEIAKLKQYISSNDAAAFKVSLSSIKSYCHNYLHFMGANWHNIL